MLLKNSPIFKTSAALKYNAANVSLELEQTQQAIGYYMDSIEIFPSFRRAHKNLGVAYMKAEQLKEAKEALIRAVELGDMSGPTMGLLGYCHLQNDHEASALQAYRLAQISEPTIVDWKAGIAQCLLATNQSEEALALVEEVVAARPSESSYQLLLVSVLLDLKKDLQAISVLELLHRSEKLELNEMALLAQLHSRSGNSRLARPLFELLIAALDPVLLPQYLNAVEIVMHNAEWSYAAELLEAVPGEIALTEKLQNRLQRLRALSLVQSGEQGAERLLEKVLEVDPLDGEALLLLAKVKLKDDTTAADFYLTRAENIESVRYRALIEFGKLRASENKFSEALEKFEKADAIHSNPEQRKYISALKRML
ncbi:tetratricopeptide repeat protein [Rubritalea sp.]|uniref:tetratricopeptide repeat protein n=1 Tax=Rubritalea sp. TaxID=2109375 RepID=UPI003242DFDB